MTQNDYPSPRPLPSDEELKRHLEDAHLPTLLPALAYLTGDLSLLTDEFRPDHVSTALGFRFQGGLSEEQQSRARSVALEVISGLLRDGRGRRSAAPSGEELRQVLQYMLGDIGEDYFPALLRELGLDPAGGAPSWTKSQLAPDRPFTVAVIGAGLSGIAAAYRLKQAGIPFVILERNAGVGGVWWENTYPGCRLDTSNFSYSYSFFQNGSWEEQYSSRGAVLDYLQRSAQEFELSGLIRFGTKVVAGEFDEFDGSWKLTLQNQEGSTEQMRVQAVVSAVGQLNEPNFPTFAGGESFQGPAWHTARWNHDVDLVGKRVGVIGTGASAFQAIQEIAEVASEVTVFQRTAPWVVPTPGYNSALKSGLRWLFDNVPDYFRWYRVSSFWASVDSRRPYAEVDPDWSHPVSMSEKNELLRRALLENLERELGDRPDLLAKMTPNYPPYGKRTLRDDGRWMATLKRPNVRVVTDPIDGLAANGVRTHDGSVHECDAIVYGTGFRASEFLLATMTLKGLGGADLEKQWDGDPRAYYGITVPNFPNWFTVFGPNTGLNANGSIVFFSEAGIDYIIDALRLLLESGHRYMDVRQDVFEEYNERIDAANRGMVYGASKVNSWYKNANGRVTANWPLKSIEYWKGTRSVRVSDYTFG